MRSTSNPLRHLLLALNVLACLRLGAQAPPAVPALPGGPVEASPPGAAPPAERFLARLEGLVQASQGSAQELERRQTEVTDRVTQEHQRLDEQKRLIDELRALLEKSGVGSRTGQQLRLAYARTQDTARRLEGDASTALAEALEAHRSRLFEVGDLSRNLTSSIEKDLAAASPGLSDAERQTLEARALDARKRLEALLAGEERLLKAVIDKEEELETVATQLADQVAQTQQYILPRLFWIRDASPLIPARTAELKREVLRLVDWVGEVARSRADIVRGFSSPQAFVLLALVAVVLPVVLVWSSSRLRRGLRRTDEAKSRWAPLRTLLFSLVRAALFPAYFAVAAGIVRGFQLPGSISSIAANMLLGLAWAFAALYLLRTMLGSGKLLETSVGLPVDVSVSIQRLAGSLFVLYAALAVPAQALSAAPFGLEIIPRVAHCALGLLALGPIALFLRRTAPLPQRVIRRAGEGFVGRNWSFLRGLVLLVLFGCVLLDVFGFRSAAASIGLRLTLSVATAFALFGLHDHVARAVERVFGWIVRPTSTPESVDSPGVPSPASASSAAATPASAQAARVQRVTRLLLIASGVLLCAWYWGINENVLRSLRSISLYRISDTEMVALSDVITAVFAAGATAWLLKNLPGIYELTLFPRVNFDTGLRYATLTISRYSILLLGVLIVLSAIHLDLSRLGWLMAALGFGLGFGLQEIFSNFVSGIILLVERPVRVGDIVRVGDVVGTVARINIRATTVIDGDRFEVVIPNKELITSKVTNWTLNDSITRLVIPIGVAYGTPVKPVIDLLVATAEAQPEILRDPPPAAFFMAHGESSLNFELRCFVADPSVRTPIVSRLNTLLYEELGKRGIEIPFPARDVHLRADAAILRALGGKPQAEEERELDPGVHA